MPKTRTTWREKLEKKQERKMVDTPRGMMLVPVPLDIDALVRQVPEGRLVTVNQIRDRLARDHGADYACPLATGWFVRIVAEKAEEDLREGVENIAPYWRVIKADGSLNEKFPGGTEAQAFYLRSEGYEIEAGQAKKPPRVVGFQNYLEEL